MPVDVQTIYLYALIIAGSLTILYLLFGDVFESIIGIGDIAPGSILNPVVILSFLAILSGMGYILEVKESFTSIINLCIAGGVAFVLVSLIHLFILLPLAKSEQSTAESVKSFIGKDGEVITTIPTNGVGEVLILSQFGSTGNIATSITNEVIKEGTLVLVIDVTDEAVLVVSPYKDGKIT